MITAQEYVKDKPIIAFLHALDVLDYCLKDNPDNPSAYKHPNEPQDNGRRIRMKKLLEQEREIKDVEFGDLQDKIMAPKPKTTIVDSETGEIDVDRYLAGERLCFDEPIKIPQDVSSMSLVLDMAISWHERELTDMIARHRETYRLALHAENNRIPCRVIAAVGLKIAERQVPIRLYLVIKDYDDPIFPGIWGAFETNATTNDFLNVILDYLVGTRTKANGRIVNMTVDQEIDDDTIIILHGGGCVITNKGPQ
jgi:hypothetical protein